MACSAGASVTRVNARDGGTEIFEFGPEEWTFRAGWHDLAISPPLRLDSRVHKVEAVWAGDLLTKEGMGLADIGPAEDVFTVGRFVDYGGAETNEPSYRFGNISIVEADIKQPTGYFGKSIVIDMHSRTGYSGSPVWIYRTPVTVFSHQEDLAMTWHYLKVLGIQWEQFPDRLELKDVSSSKPKKSQAGLITDGKYVEGYSGMTCAVPADAIMELLMDSKLQEMRKTVDEEIAPDMEGKMRPRATGTSHLRFHRPQRAIEKHLGLDQLRITHSGLW